MKRRKFIALLGAAAVAWPLVAHAQQSKEIPRLCFLTFDPGTLQSRSPRFDVFFNSLRDLGYVDGKTIVIDYLSADGKDDRFPALVSECLRLKADIIAVSTTPAALKRLDVLKEAVPKVSRVLVLSYLSDPVAPLQVAALDRVAPSLGVTLLVRDVRSGADLAAAFDAGMSEHVDGLIMTAESVLVVHSAQIGEFAARLRLPAIYPYAIQVRNGGLMAYEANIPELHKNAALYVDKILKGAKPSDLPIQQPTKLSLFINLKAAKALGLELPQSLLTRADEVIE
jgi:putative ABC transport system substrate-binding protein